MKIGSINNRINIKNNKIKIMVIGVILLYLINLGNISFSKADEDNTRYSSVKRDTHISLDSSDNLNITRSDKKNNPMGKDSWSIFIYMTGSDLVSNYQSATKDIQEMLVAKCNNPNVNIIIQTGGCGKWHTEGIDVSNLGRYRIKGDKLEKIDTVDLASMGKASTLYNYLEWGVTNYPAEHMAVIFWDHGSGYEKNGCNGISIFSPLSLMSMSDFNICRNALISPYWINILVAIPAYSMQREAKVYGANISYTINEWENSDVLDQWFALPDGQLLTTYVIDNTDTYTIYGFPVVINDVESMIKIKETKTNTEKKEYTVLGVWDGTFKSNHVPRGYIPLEIGTVIIPIYDVYNKNTDEYEIEYGEEYVVGLEFDFVYVKLENEGDSFGVIMDMMFGKSIMAGDIR